MNLDDKLGPISRRLGPVGRAYHRIDDEVHRYYEKIVRRWEEDGHERKTLAVTAAGGALLTFFASGTPAREIFDTNIETVSEAMSYGARIVFSFYAGCSSGHLLMGASIGTHDGVATIGDQKVVISPYRHRMWRFLRGHRLTTLAGGCGALIAGGVQLINGFRDHDAYALNAGAYLCEMGLFGIGHASATYFVDKEPALLDRAPAWKQGLSAVKDALTPAPEPVPVHVPE